MAIKESVTGWTTSRGTDWWTRIKDWVDRPSVLCSRLVPTGTPESGWFGSKRSG